MNLDDLDRKAERLHEASVRIGANLVELEVDSSRDLLEASKLAGKSAAQWATASAALTELWQWHGQLQALLERVDSVRGRWRFDQLRELLDGSSIELTTTEVPIADRDLLDDPHATVRCSPDELIGRMSTVFDEVKTAMSQIADAWDVLIPRLDAARRVLAESTSLAAELGGAERADLDQAAHALGELSASLSADPLSVAPVDIDVLARSLEAIHTELSSTAALRRGLDARVSDARALLDELRAAVRSGEAAHREASVKISVPAAPAALELRQDLEAELTEVVTLARGGAWREAHQMLEQWTARARALLDEAHRILAANRVPIKARDDFRALLEAYQVKAKRLGLLEDPGVAGIFDQAHAELYNAPTDLARVGQLIRRYQEALGASPPTPEVPR